MELTWQTEDDSWHLRPLRASEAPALQDLCFKCTDYFLLLNGDAPQGQEATEILTEQPPQPHQATKWVLGLWQQHRLVGVLDLLTGYPTPEYWFIGLLLLDPRERGQGLGTRLHQELAQLARQNGVSKMRLGVLAHNRFALDFWQDLGYTEISRNEPRRIGKLDHLIVMMEKTLSVSD